MPSLFNPSLQVWEYLYQRFSESLPLTLGLILIWHQLSVPRRMALQRRLSVEVPRPLFLLWQRGRLVFSSDRSVGKSWHWFTPPQSCAQVRPIETSWVTDQCIWVLAMLLSQRGLVKSPGLHTHLQRGICMTADLRVVHLLNLWICSP